MQKTNDIQVPAPPPAPSAPMIVTPRALGAAPISAADVEALLARKEVLSNQLNSAVGRRRDLAHQLRSATGLDKTGLEQRLGVLDGRIARLEQEIDENGRLLSAAPAARLAQQQGMRFSFGPDTPARMSEVVGPLSIVFTLFVLFPISLSITRLFWKRGSRPRAAVADRETAQRLERMEQAMDAIAIEIERVSEGQRFVTRLMAEGRAGALGNGQPGMEPLRVAQGDQAPLTR